MEVEKNQSVEVEVVGDGKLEISYNSPLLEDHLLDYPSVPEEERLGQMRRLLCASVVGCFTGTVYFALASRGAQIKTLKGTGVASTGKADESSPKVRTIDIRVEVDIDDEDSQIFERVKKIVEEGCLISRSIAPSITVTHSIVRI